MDDSVGRPRRKWTPVHDRVAGEVLPAPFPHFYSPRSVQRGSRVDLHRLRGIVVGSAVGDALGAPFEFGPSGGFSRRFPPGSGRNEMAGGGGWDAGEFTDDTQMAICEAEAYVEAGGIDEELMFSWFREWLESGPKDVGLMTREVLSDPDDWPVAPRRYYEANPDNAAGNGSLMRFGFMAARSAVSADLLGCMEIGRRLSVVTHGDPAAVEGRALAHEQMLIVVNRKEIARPGDDAYDGSFRDLKDGQREAYVDALSDSPDWSLSNGTVWGCLRDAIWCVRASSSFEECMRLACDVGDDVDTVAAVAGAFAGALYGLEGIPERWVERVHGTVLGKRYDATDLIALLDAVLEVDELYLSKAIGWKPEETNVRYGYEEFFDATKARKLRRSEHRQPD